VTTSTTNINTVNTEDDSEYKSLQPKITVAKRQVDINSIDGVTGFDRVLRFNRADVQAVYLFFNSGLKTYDRVYYEINSCRLKSWCLTVDDTTHSKSGYVISLRDVNVTRSLHTLKNKLISSINKQITSKNLKCTQLSGVYLSEHICSERGDLCFVPADSGFNIHLQTSNKYFDKIYEQLRLMNTNNDEIKILCELVPWICVRNKDIICFGIKCFVVTMELIKHYDVIDDFEAELQDD